MRISRNIHRKRLQDARKHRYEVQVIIKEHPVQAFADTGADICIMSKSQAKELGLPLKRTRMKIHPYGSNKMRCCGSYTGTIMYGSNVVNTVMYIIDRPVETLLSGRVAKELGIVTFNEPVEKNPSSNAVNTIRQVNSDKLKPEIIVKYLDIFKGVGQLKNWKWMQ